MKVPELDQVDDAALKRWSGSIDPLKSAAADANLAFNVVDLAHAADKTALFAALDKGLALPEHFGANFDALADCLEDRDWLGTRGRVIAIQNAAAFRKAHARDFGMLEEILSEASAYWQERHVAFWVFVA